MAVGPGAGDALVEIVDGVHACVDLEVRRRYGSWLTDLSNVLSTWSASCQHCEVSDVMRGAHVCGLPITHGSAEHSPRHMVEDATRCATLLRAVAQSGAEDQSDGAPMRFRGQARERS